MNYLYDRLAEVKKQHGLQKKKDFFGATLHPRDVDWLIEQAEKAERYEVALKEIADNNVDTPFARPLILHARRTIDY